jgi:hypothetical protein
VKNRSDEEGNRNTTCGHVSSPRTAAVKRIPALDSTKKRLQCTLCKVHFNYINKINAKGLISRAEMDKTV